MPPHRRIFEMWLACHTQEEIAEAVGCSQGEVAKSIPNGELAEQNKPAASHLTDFDSRHPSPCDHVIVRPVRGSCRAVCDAPAMPRIFFGNQSGPISRYNHLISLVGAVGLEPTAR
jgi:hypothetical protein